MTKELQDHVWSVLPKEFKEGVKRMWSVEVDCATKYKSELHKHRVDLLYELFGEHLHWQNNLTSDSEGEEMLTCVKDQAVKLYNIANKAYAINGDKYYQGYMNAMIDLFGSKCLPDGLNADNFAKSEPKFHKGDKVEVINYDFGLPSLSRCVHEVFTVSDAKYNANQWMYKLETNKWLFNERDYLESIQWCEHFLKAYKEPNPAEGYDVFNDPEPKCLHFKDGKCAHPAVAHLENGKLVKGADCDVSSCEDVEYEPKPSELKEEADEHFDTIVKGGFRNERRLNIATQITASIYANDEIASRFESIEALVRKALDIAGTLIAECEKGGNHD